MENEVTQRISCLSEGNQGWNQIKTQLSVQQIQLNILKNNNLNL